MASIDVAKLLNKITQDIPGINTVLKALANWDVSALSDVPDGAMQATTDANNNLTIKKKVSGSYTPITKLMHDVDKIDGYHASTSATANAVAVRNASGALPGNILGNSATADTATALAAGSVVPVNQGGTGATTASQARANLGVADGADFATHIAKQASPSVEGHVKLDALAADGSNTAAPGGFGLGMPLAAQIPANTDLDTVVLPGFYSCRMTNTATTLTNCPVVVAFSMFVEYGAYGPTQTITTYTDGARFQRTKTSSTTFGPWRSLPNGITDSTATTSSTVAASAKAVKAAYDKATTATNATAPATTTARGIGRVATSADLVGGATISNGPAFLAAGSEAVTATPTAHAVPQADASGKLDSGYLPVVPVAKGGTGVDVSVPVLQRKHYRTGEFAQGNTLTPADDTIPQITEGDQYMSLNITPKSATSRLRIEVVFLGAPTADTVLTVALHKIGTPDALATVARRNGADIDVIAFSHEMVSGSTATQTFTVRAGIVNNAACVFNGRFSGGPRIFGGVAASSITITEYAS